MKKIFTLALSVIFAVSFLFFAMINREVIALDLAPFPYEVEVRLFILVGVLLLSGIFLGWVVASFECRRRYLVQRETKRRLQALEEEVVILRSRQALSSSHETAVVTASPPQH